MCASSSSPLISPPLTQIRTLTLACLSLPPLSAAARFFLSSSSHLLSASVICTHHEPENAVRPLRIPGHLVDVDRYRVREWKLDGPGTLLVNFWSRGRTRCTARLRFLRRSSTVSACSASVRLDAVLLASASIEPGSERERDPGILLYLRNAKAKLVVPATGLPVVGSLHTSTGASSIES